MTTFDATKPVQTFAGNPAKIVHTFENGDLLYVDGKTDEAWRTHSSGKFRGYRVEYPHEGDLINIPVKHERWVNFYKYGPRDEVSVGGRTYASHAEASASGGKQSSRIACILVAFTEGEGL